jgi:hypothetical protein
LERPTDLTSASAGQPTLFTTLEPQSEAAEQQSNEQVRTERASYWLDETGIPILRATRSWVQYGTLGFAVMCILIGAVEGLFGR